MKELQQGYEPFFPAPVVHNEYCKEYWAMSHTRSRLLNHIATKLVPYVCDHEFETWTADRHYNDAKCRRGTCLCCFARTKHGYEPHNQYVCQYVDMRDIVLAYGVARPRWWYVFTAAERQAKKAWGKGRVKAISHTRRKTGTSHTAHGLSPMNAISHKTVVSRRSSPTAHSKPLRRSPVQRRSYNCPRRAMSHKRTRHECQSPSRISSCHSRH